MLKRLSPYHLHILEAAFMGLFFVQALRLLIGLVYSRVASAALVAALDPNAINRSLPGIVEPAQVQSEISFLLYMIALPVLTLLLGRYRWLLLVSVLVVAVGRALVNLDTGFTTSFAAALVIGGSLVYLTMLVRHRAWVLPYFFIFGFGIDQIIRAAGDTLDPSWSSAYATTQLILSGLVIILSLIGSSLIRLQQDDSNPPPGPGLLPVWSGFGLGALLYLQLALLALPNAIAGRADVDYTLFAPLVVLATFLPLIPWVRSQLRTFIGIFDGSLRGWVWMLVCALLIVLGTRFPGIIGGVALVLAQATVSMLWWWLVRPQAERERNISGLWIMLAALVLALLIAGDTFTYEYAFVRDTATGIAALDAIIPALLRGFRGMGLALLLLAVFLAALPMTQVRRRIPWQAGTTGQTILAVLLVAAASGLTAYLVRPPLVSAVRDVEGIRAGTYNIHAGYNEFFDYDLEAIARTIAQSGANVVLLQEIEAGRLTSFGVDQALWLARRLGMDRRFFATNEGLQGLAVLSNIEIVFDEGHLLTSSGQQTGVQRVQVRPDAGPVTFYNTWLGLLLEGSGDHSLEQQEQDQQRQLNEIFAIIARDHPDGNLGRLVVGGTFNNTPTSPLAQQMRDAGFVDPFAGLPLEFSATLVRTNTQARVDYLWVRPPLLATNALALDTAASDHRMAVIALQISRR